MNTHEQRLRALERALDCLQVESSNHQQQPQQQYNPMTSAAMTTTLQTPLGNQKALYNVKHIEYLLVYLFVLM
jgi:hypothetical protein